MKKARHLNGRVEAIRETLDELETQAERVTANLSDMPKAESPDPHSNESIVVKMMDMKAVLSDYMAELLKMKYNIVKMAGLLDSLDEQKVIEQRYVHMKSWQDIADIMCVSLRSVYRLHGSALVNLEREVMEKKLAV